MGDMVAQSDQQVLSAQKNLGYWCKCSYFHGTRPNYIQCKWFLLFFPLFKIFSHPALT